jgi:hypothetical protein
MIRYYLGIFGYIGVFISLLLPFARYKSAALDMYGFSGSIVSQPLLSYSPFLAFLVAGAALAFAMLLHRDDKEKLQIATWVLGSVAALTLLYSFRDILMQDGIIWRAGFPMYYGHPAINIGWLTLAICTICCYIASREDETDVAKRTARTTNDSKHKDSGKCLQCGQLNSIQSTRCHSCYATLPWAKPTHSPSIQKRGTGINSIAKLNIGEWVQTAVPNFLTFAFCFLAPLLGYFLWRYMEKEDSPYTGTALIGWIIGIVFSIIILAGRFVQIGQSV